LYREKSEREREREKSLLCLFDKNKKKNNNNKTAACSVAIDIAILTHWRHFYISALVRLEFGIIQVRKLPNYPSPVMYSSIFFHLIHNFVKNKFSCLKQYFFLKLTNKICG